MTIGKRMRRAVRVARRGETIPPSGWDAVVVALTTSLFAVPFRYFSTLLKFIRPRRSLRADEKLAVSNWAPGQLCRTRPPFLS